jgi:hypothetical protein
VAARGDDRVCCCFLTGVKTAPAETREYGPTLGELGPVSLGVLAATDGAKDGAARRQTLSYFSFTGHFWGQFGTTKAAASLANWSDVARSFGGKRSS